MFEKQINAQVMILFMDLCKHCKQTKQNPTDVVNYFVKPGSKGLDLFGYLYMVKKILPFAQDQIIEKSFSFILKRFELQILTSENFEQLMNKIESQMTQQELNSPIQFKINVQNNFMKEMNSQLSNQYNEGNPVQAQHDRKPIFDQNFKQPQQINIIPTREQRLDSQNKVDQKYYNRSSIELIQIFSSKLQNANIDIIDVFNKYDNDKDHKMNEIEFKNMIQIVIKDINEQELKELICWVFKEQNKELTAFQFKRLCESQVQVIGQNIMESNYYENPANQKLLQSNFQFQELYVQDQNVVAMKEFIQKYQQLKSQNQYYTDSVFPPNQQSLGRKLEKFKWKRIPEFIKNPKFFVKENTLNRFGLGKWIAPDDLQQGQLGDCYFLASISSLGNRRPDLLLETFVTRTFNPNGLYGVKLCIDGEWKVIGMDDYIPTWYDQAAFTRGKDEEIWVMVIEKAWAKVFGSYENIEAGYPTEVLRTLTGAATKTLFTKEDKFMEELQTCIQNRCIMVCSTKNENKQQYKQMGLISGHAYTVLKIKDLNANTKLIKLRNPWGKEEWKGDWSNQSSLWTPQQKTLFKINNNNDGVFYMSITDFLKYFDDVSVCFVKEGYQYQSQVIQSNKRKSEYYLIQIDKQGCYYFTINQKNVRFENSNDYSTVKILLFKGNQLISGNCKCERECWISANLEYGKYTLVVKTQWRYSQMNKYVLSSYGPNKVQIDKINKINNLLREAFLDQARKSSKKKSYQKHPDIKQAYEFNLKFGYGFYYVENKSGKSFESKVRFTKLEGLKLRKPYRGDSLEISLGGQDEFLVLLSICDRGYSFGIEEQYIVK